MEELLKYKDYALFLMGRFPQHKGEINDFWLLAKDEIESGESIDNEISLFLNDVEEITGLSYRDYLKMS